MSSGGEINPDIKNNFSQSTCSFKQRKNIKKCTALIDKKIQNQKFILPVPLQPLSGCHFSSLPVSFAVPQWLLVLLISLSLLFVFFSLPPSALVNLPKVNIQELARAINNIIIRGSGANYTSHKTICPCGWICVDHGQSNFSLDSKLTDSHNSNHKLHFIPVLKEFPQCKAVCNFISRIRPSLIPAQPWD